MISVRYPNSIEFVLKKINCNTTAIKAAMAAANGSSGFNGSNDTFRHGPESNSTNGNFP